MFTLLVPITPAILSGLKAELARVLRDVKSSHRVEAMARGLGFGTYASIRAASCSNDRSVAVASGRPFVEYLNSKKFSVTPADFYRAASRVAIKAVLETTPKLTMAGIGAGQPQRKADGKWESAKEWHARFADFRGELLSESAVESFLLSLAFLSIVRRTRSIRPDANSYRIKHIAENFACSYPEEASWVHSMFPMEC